MKTDKELAGHFFQSEVDDYRKEFYESGYRTFMSVRLDYFLKEIDRLNLTSGAKCLDMGCGPGYLASALYLRGFDVTAIDASKEMLRLTQELLASMKNKDNQHPPQVCEGDIEDIPVDDDSLDMLGSAGVLEYLTNDDKAFSEFYRVLKNKGVLIISSTNKYSPAGYFEPLIEAIKRITVTRNACNWVLKKLGRTPVRARDFQVRKHSSSELIRNLQKSGFIIEKVGYFYALPFPHPFDRVFPRFSNFMGKKLEKLSKTPLRYLFEGIYVVARK